YVAGRLDSPKQLTSILSDKKTDRQRVDVKKKLPSNGFAGLDFGGSASDRAFFAALAAIDAARVHQG
uniref:hypothetical protein n=1 Tax=Enterobacter hormaechei TaxID=158836 RepID=UPI00195491CC